FQAWAEAAHQARIDQGLPEFIEDDETVDFIASLLLATPPRRAEAPEPSAGATAIVNSNTRHTATNQGRWSRE
ncbi:MAG: hypothetical protein ACRDYV_16830, partial [Acidimicrobiia bacterium]